MQIGCQTTCTESHCRVLSIAKQEQLQGLKTLGTASSPGVEAFSRDGANTFSFDIRINTGPQVIGVVPQPITRNNLSLSQATNQIAVYFDQAEVLDSSSAENTSFYRLFEVNSDSGDDVGSVIVPAQVDYSSSDHKATLTFSAALAADKLFRLEVGEQTESIEISPVSVGEIVIEESPLPAPEIHPFNITFNPLLTPRPTFTDDPSPTFAGTGRAGATVTLVVDSDNDGIPETVIGTTVVGNNDQWSITPEANLRSQANGGPEGRVAFFAFQTDSFGRVSPTLSSHVDIDITDPTQPLIDQLLPQATTTPTITGVGEPGAALTLFNRVDGAGVVLNTNGREIEVDADGTWTLPIVEPLPEGVLTFFARQRDAAGNVSDDSLDMVFEVDLTPPPTPAFDLNDINGEEPPILRSRRPAITGTGDPGATLTLGSDGFPENGIANTIVGTTFVAADGTWRIVPAVDLPENYDIDANGNLEPTPLLLEISQTDPAGNENRVRETITVIVDTTPPEEFAPPELQDGNPLIFVSVTNPTTVDEILFTNDVDDDPDPLLSDTGPLIRGTGDPGATVTLMIDRDSDDFAEFIAATTLVDDDGNWSISFTPDLVANANTDFVDPAAFPVGTPLDQGVIQLSATQVDQAGHTSSAETQQIIVDTIALAPVFDEFDLTNDPRPVITGTGEPGATLTLQDNNGDDLAAPVLVRISLDPDLNGTWEVQPLDPLPDGVNPLVAVQTDKAGNTSLLGNGSIEIDTTAPNTMTLDEPFTPTNDGFPVITGTGEAGATVTLRADTDGDVNTVPVVIGTAVVQPDTTWSIKSSTNFTGTDGDRLLTLSQVDLAGNSSDLPELEGTIERDTTPSDAPAFDPDSLALTGDVRPVITGTGVIGDTVVLLGDTDGDSVPDTVLGTSAVVDVNSVSEWSITPGVDLPGGLVSLVAYQVDAAGNISASTSDTIEIDLEPPAAPEINVLPIQITKTPTITGLGTPGLEVTLEGDADFLPATPFTELGTAIVQANGTWSITTTDLVDGTIALSATQENSLGASGPAGTGTVEVRIDAPGAPAFDAASLDTTSDTTPTITGTGSVGALIRLRADIDRDGTVDTTIGSVVVGADGTWSVTASEDLPVDTAPGGAAIAIAATQFDANGIESAATQNAITIDPHQPDAPEITSGGLTNNKLFPIQGTGEAGAIVTLEADGEFVDTGTVLPNGTWSITPPANLPEGAISLAAIQVDAAATRAT